MRHLLFEMFEGIAVIHGEEKDVEESGHVDGRQSPPPNPVAAFELFPCKTLDLIIYLSP